MARRKPTLESMLSEMSGVFDRLEPPITPRLRPPASRQEIQDAEAALGLRFPDELRSLLACHNGQQCYEGNSGYGDPVVPMMRLPPNDETLSHCWLAGTHQIVEQTKHYREEYGEYFKEEQFEVFGPACHHDKFILFTETENADCLVLDMAPEPGGKIGQVLMYCTQPFEIAVIADNLSSFIHTLLSGYKTGRYAFDSNEYFVSYCES